jgi:hypothetical protein
MAPSRTSGAKDKCVCLASLTYVQPERWKFKFCLKAIWLSSRALGYAEIA